MAYGIVHRSGGHISVFSKIGVGTVMRIDLPQRPDPSGTTYRGIGRGTWSVRKVAHCLSGYKRILMRGHGKAGLATTLIFYEI